MRNLLIPIIAMAASLGSLSYTAYVAWKGDKLRERWERIERSTQGEESCVIQRLCLDEENTNERVIRYIPCDSVEARQKRARGWL